MFCSEDCYRLAARIHSQRLRQAFAQRRRLQGMTTQASAASFSTSTTGKQIISSVPSVPLHCKATNTTTKTGTTAKISRHASTSARMAASSISAQETFLAPTALASQVQCLFGVYFVLIHIRYDAMLNFINYGLICFFPTLNLAGNGAA